MLNTCLFVLFVTLLASSDLLLLLQTHARAPMSHGVLTSHCCWPRVISLGVTREAPSVLLMASLHSLSSTSPAIRAHQRHLLGSKESAARSNSAWHTRIWCFPSPLVWFTLVDLFVVCDRIDPRQQRPQLRVGATHTAGGGWQ
jgi:hypothetical protein